MFSAASAALDTLKVVRGGGFAPCSVSDLSAAIPELLYVRFPRRPPQGDPDTLPTQIPLIAYYPHCPQVVLTEDGRAAQLVAKYRPPCPVIAVSTNGRALRSLASTFGVIPLKVRPSKARCCASLLSDASCQLSALCMHAGCFNIDRRYLRQRRQLTARADSPIQRVFRFHLSLLSPKRPH